jgi:hypothetical protein
MKDLKIFYGDTHGELGRRAQDIIIIDNRAISYASLHLVNGIPIRDYEGVKEGDCELEILTTYLMNTFVYNGGSKVQDVRAIIKRDFHLDRIIAR